jgi:hypothetical protein
MKITLDGLDAIPALIARFAALPEDVAKAKEAALNDAAQRIQDSFVSDLVASVGLDAAYVRGLMKITRATRERHIALISARKRGVRLARYDAQQRTQPAKIRARGDKRRAIGPGLKQAGVQVTVKRGRAKVMPKAFLMPLKGAGLWGVFVRLGRRPKDVKHLHSLSPDQAFRHYITRQGPQLSDVLMARFRAHLAAQTKGQRLR